MTWLFLQQYFVGGAKLYKGQKFWQFWTVQKVVQKQGTSREKEAVS